MPAQRGADLGDDRVRSSRQIRAGEPQKVDSGLEKPVLPLVVGREAIAMVFAVVLDAELCLPVAEIEASQEGTPSVVNRHLRLWSWQPAPNQEQAQPGFHRRLCLGLRELENPAGLYQPRDLFLPRHVRGEILLIHQARSERLIDGHHRFHQGKAAGQIEAGAERAGDGQSVAEHNVA